MDIPKGKMMGEQLPDQVPTFVFRISSLEHDVAELKRQLGQYVPVRENDLQTKNVRDIVDRIEKDVLDAKSRLSDINNKLVMQENESQKREAEQRESQAATQIKVLWGTISLIIGLLSSVLVGYITHFFH